VQNQAAGTFCKLRFPYEAVLNIKDSVLEGGCYGYNRRPYASVTLMNESRLERAETRHTLLATESDLANDVFPLAIMMVWKMVLWHGREV
jgi:hypothetical protein